MAHLHADLAFANELFNRRLVVAKARAQHFDGDDLSRRLVNATEDARKRTRTDQILDAVIAVVIARRLTLAKTFDLVFR